MKSFFSSLLFLLTLSTYGISQPTRLWIDTDLIIGKYTRDVDDGVALKLCLQSPQVNVAGISIVKNLAHGYKKAQQFVSWYAPTQTIGIYKGAKSEKELGKETPATQALAAALAKEKLSILVIGQATNIGTLVANHPEVVGNIERIVFCAGRSKGTHFSLPPFKQYLLDYNFEHDTAAFALLLKSNVPMVFAGYEATQTIYLSKQDIEPLKNSNNKGDRWMHRKLTQWINIWSSVLGVKKGFIPFDAVTAGYFIAPQYLHCVPAAMRIQPEVNDGDRILKGATKPNLNAFVSPTGISLFCDSTAPAYKQLLINSFTSPTPLITTK